MHLYTHHGSCTSQSSVHHYSFGDSELLQWLTFSWQGQIGDAISATMALHFSGDGQCSKYSHQETASSDCAVVLGVGHPSEWNAHIILCCTNVDSDRH